MRKKSAIFAVFMLLLAAVFAVNVMAVENASCPCCGKANSQIDWQPWTLTQGGSANALKTDAHYYLTGDVTSFSAQVRIGDGTAKPKITLDLRGFTLASSQRMFGVYHGSTLSIVDTVGGGKVQGTQTSNAQVGGVIRVNEGATLNLYGGTVEDVSTAAHAANGAVIATEGSNVTINVSGGTVKGSTFAPDGGAIFANKGAKVNVSAGAVIGGKACRGGAIFVNNATLTVSGGTVTGGQALNENNSDAADAATGGAIYATNSAIVNLNGGVVNGGSALYGGAVFAADNAQVTVAGGIVNGSVCESGGAFGMRAASLSVKSGTVNGGKVKNYGSAIHLFADKVNETAVACSVTISGGRISAHPENKTSAISMAANSHTVTMTGGEVVGAQVACSTGAAFSGQGTGATITVNGGTVSGVTSADISRCGLIYSRGMVVINGGTFHNSGDGAVVYMYQRYCKLTLSDAMATALSGKIWLEDGAKMSTGAAITKGVRDMWHSTVSGAVSAAGENDIVKLYQAGTVDLQGKTLYLDINGLTPVVNNGHFYGLDTAGDTYKSTACGSVTGTATFEAMTNAPDGRRYLSHTDGGKTSFHRFFFGIEDISLRTEMGREGVYFSSFFAGDEVVKGKIDSFGIAVSKQNLGAEENWLTAMENGTAANAAYGVHRFQTGVAPENQTRTTGVVVKNIINHTNDTETNVENAKTWIYGRAYIRFADGTCLMDTQVAGNMADALLWCDGNYEKLSAPQQAGLVMLYDRFMAFMNKIPTLHIRSVFDDQILTARRETVWQEMVDMNSILWTVDKEITYSFHASSKGIETDLANQQASATYNPLSDDIGTFYPDRVYQGLPYTHASANNSSVEQLGVRDEYGVYHLSANPSLFTGGATSGTSATTGAYNVARVGNDCWDMVYWAWNKVSTTVSADQTVQMTPDFGVQIVGQEILEKALRAGGYITDAQTLLDYICTPSNASAIRGKLIYLSNATGLVRDGTRTKSGSTYDYQVLYQTYTMLQRGDAMVRYNSSGHAIMVGGVTVVYNEDGTINGDKSTLLILEQGSANEEYQARRESEFSSSVTAKHSSHSSVNKSCMYCCGYTDRIIDGKHVWLMDHPPQEISFRKLAETYYMGVTCAELNENLPGEVPAVSYTNTSGAVAYIYSGRLTSNYRISTVTLEIYNEAGVMVNTASLFGIQDSVRSPFYLNRFVTDQTKGAYGSVVAGTPALQKSGVNIVADLPAGNYTYVYKCQIGTEQWFQFATGSFTVDSSGRAS